MKLIINIASISKGGAEQVAASFVNECKNQPKNKYFVFVRDNISKQLDIDSFPENFEFIFLDNRSGKSLLNLYNNLKIYSKKTKDINPDCIISTGGHGYFTPKFIPVIGGFNIAHYIYPESPYFLNMSFKKRLYWWWMRKVHMLFYNRLDTVIVQTDDVKKRLKQLLSNSQPIYTVSNTVHSAYIQKKNKTKKLPTPKDNEIRLLTLSSYYPHKNIEIIKRIIPFLNREKNYHFKFVLTLPKLKFESIFSEEEQKHIYNLGKIPIEECPALYNEIDFMFLPTLLECYSASYAEAMTMKKPILTSDLGFAHTVCKDAAEYFNPIDAQDVAQTILNLSANKTRQIEMISRGTEIMKNTNTAAERAAEFLKICEITVNKKIDA